MMLSTIAQLALIFAAAKVAGEVMVRLGQPAVIGELLAGVALGPSIAGWIHPSEPLQVLAQIGVVVLLFLVGLETHPDDLRKVGVRAAAVAVAGVVLSFGGGLGAARATGFGGTESLFVATALVATSVSITARLLKESNLVATYVGRLILGAALIDDILGLILLAIVAGSTRGTLRAWSVVALAVEALAFVALAVLVAPKIVGRIADLFERPRIPRAPFALAMMAMLGLSAAANTIGLASVIGAFLAGMALAQTRDRYQLIAQAEPLGDFLSPFFFVLTGTRIELAALGSGRVIGLAALITVVAVVSKSVASLAAGRTLDRRDRAIVAAGMIPRGEVGIIVAALASNEGVIGKEAFSAVIAMVLVTTLIAPTALRLALKTPTRTDPPALPLA